MLQQMKKIAIIGASYLQLPLVLKAKEMGLKVICFAWKEGAVCAEYSDTFYPISIIEKDEILSVCQKEKIDGICTIASDVAAPTVAYVAEKMGLKGNSFESAVKANNKSLMRQAFYASSVPCPKFDVVESPDAAFGKEWKFPLIVKPIDRSGSLGVTKVEDISTLGSAIETALSYSFSHKAMVEEFIEGREISVEFISFNGEHYPLTITDKVTTGAPHFVELEHHQPSTLPSATYDEIYGITRRALDSLGVTNGASHTEYKITEDGRIYIIELGARMGGDFIGSDLVYLSTGYDFVKGVIEVALDQFDIPVLKKSRHSGVYFFCKETEKLKSIVDKTTNPQWMVRKEITSAELKKVKCSSDRSGYFIYQSEKKIVL